MMMMVGMMMITEIIIIIISWNYQKKQLPTKLSMPLAPIEREVVRVF